MTDADPTVARPADAGTTAGTRAASSSTVAGDSFVAGDGLIDSSVVSLERTGKATYVARNESGGEILIGPEGTSGVFSPGELLKAALAACNAMSADSRLSHALGPDFPSETVIETLKNEAEERYERFRVTVTAPIQDLEPEQRERVIERGTAAVKKWCTVGRTIEAGARYEFRLVGDGE